MASMSNFDSLPSFVIRKVTQEVSQLVSKAPEGIQVHPNEENVSDIQATVEGPAGTPYEGGLFRVKLVLGKDFPASPPKGFFLTKIFHPNVARNGEICVNTLKKDWKAELGIKHLLLTIKCLLIVPNPESALNEEAGKLLLEKYEEYRKYAKMMTEIHAMTKSRGGGGEKEKETTGTAETEGSQPKKRAIEKKTIDKKKSERRKNLKRL
ncbi:ubiquitin-conjugating enzyme E2 S-like [Oscarella lobularis]|uniref:ubiquitin-conjugating enzyme E2 S-like n=1 Tax=Oscarella lobularis TaxID=121494 RepID=UPI003313CBFE